MLTAQLLNNLLAAAPPSPTPTPQPGAGIDTTGIVGFLVGQILPVLVVIVGLVVIGRSKQGQWAKVISTVGILLIGVFLIGGAGTLASLGKFFAELILS